MACWWALRSDSSHSRACNKSEPWECWIFGFASSTSCRFSSTPVPRNHHRTHSQMSRDAKNERKTSPDDSRTPFIEQKNHQCTNGKLYNFHESKLKHLSLCYAAKQLGSESTVVGAPSKPQALCAESLFSRVCCQVWKRKHRRQKNHFSNCDLVRRERRQERIASRAKSN